MGVLKEGKTIGSTSAADYQQTTYTSTIKVTVSSSDLPAFKQTPGDEPYLVYLYSKQYLTLPAVENAGNTFYNLRPDSAYSQPDFYSYSTGKDRFTFLAEDPELLGDHQIVMDFNAESEEFVGAYFGISAG